jgi:2-methylisocitrate lyase-like PEP mutase family enzyme
MNAEGKRSAFARALRSDGIILAPGVFDMISAKLADHQGFEALYVTGYGLAASHLGVADAGLASYTDVVERVRVLARGTATPLICDADTGFGGLLNIRHTVEGFEEAGCVALQLEDQESPKQCGLTGGATVIDSDDMVRKLGVALEARRDPNFIIIARTDAKQTLGIDEALRRAARYAEAGADVVFVQGLASEQELTQARDRAPKPLLVNISAPAGLGKLSAEELCALGCRIAVFPGSAMLAAAEAMNGVFRRLRSDGRLPDDVPLFDREEMHRLMGFEDVWAFEQRWRGKV